MIRFSQEQKDFIRNNVHGRTVHELTELFNNRFKTEVCENPIRVFKKNNGLNSGLTGRFEPGHTPANKGKPKSWAGGEATQFRKGHRPHNYVPVGSERVNGDDYIDIKIADPNNWRGRHLLVWEEHHGQPVPKGHAVIFGDGDRRNFDPDNLILVTRGQLAVLNRKGLIQKNADLTKSGVIIADIFMKIGKHKLQVKQKSGRSKACD